MAAPATAAAGGPGHLAAAAASRLIIPKMVIENFKSYGGVKEIGPFHKSFSSVVGPNGSGKSNVIDAMLFVFGKKASQMRFNKLSELIHRSAEYPALDYARVSVFFQDIVDDGTSEDGYTVVPGSQFVVTRTAHRNNTSAYYINDKKSSMTEVTTLLKGRGIDLDHNRFLILQGEVEQIAMMKPKGAAPGDEGLLEYLEDIIGSIAYVAPIAEAEKVLDALNGQRAEKLNRLKAVEKERGGLESAKAEAEALLAKEREVSRQQGALFQKLAGEAGEAAATAERRHGDAAAKLADARAKLAALTTAMAGLTAEAGGAQAGADAAVGDAARLRERMAACERKEVKLKEDMKGARAAAKKLEEAIGREGAALAEAGRAAEAAAAALPGLEASLKKLQADKAREDEAYDAVLASLRGETEGMRDAMEAAQAALTPAAAAAAAAGAAHESARTELRLLRERLDARGKEAARLRAQLDAVDAELRGKEAELGAARAEVGGAGGKRAAAEAELADVTAREAAAADALKKARATLEEGRAAEADAGGGARSNGLVEALMAAAKPGGPLARAGLHGRLGSLGAIDAAYDVAISTACGALNWLVVDSTEGGEACVSFLRSRGLGRAKFIILDKIAWLEERSRRAFAPPPGGGDTPRLFDLVRARDARFRLAFYFALRDTLVAKDIDAAVRVAYVRGRAEHRVVTLGGELIESSGAMSGGGKTARRGGMAATLASPVSAADLAAAEAAVATLGAAVAELRARKTALAAALRDAERGAPKLATRVSKLELEIASTRALRDDVAARVKAAADDAAGEAAGRGAADAAATAAALAARVAALDADARAAAAAANALEADVSRLQRGILDAGGERVARAKARVDRASEAVEAVIKAAAKAKSEAKAAEKAGEKAGKALEKAKAEHADAVASQKRIVADFSANEAEAGGVLTALTAADVAAAAATARLATASAALAEAEKGAKASRDAAAELKAASDELEATMTAAKKKAAYWRGRFEALAQEYAIAMAQRVAELEAELADDDGGAAPVTAPTAGAASDSAAAGAAERVDAPGAAPSRGRRGVAATAAAAAAPAPAAATTAATSATLSPAVAKALAGEPLELAVLDAAALRPLSADQLQQGVAVLEGQRDELGKKVNMAAIAEYRAKNREFLKRVAELEAVSAARDGARRQFDSLRKKRLDEFMAGFSRITLRLKEMYQMITLGGDAELELVDSLDPFAEGIVFSVRPPKKSWKNISNLSGGEKTLSSLALVFALHHYKPTPLYVMDEIDAALDFKNVSIVANYIKERTKDAQFIIISLRNNMFELADRLVGIYKTRDVTKSVTINPKAIAAECGVPSGQEAYDRRGGAATTTGVATAGAPLGDRSNAM